MLPHAKLAATCRQAGLSKLAAQLGLKPTSARRVPQVSRLEYRLSSFAAKCSLGLAQLQLSKVQAERVPRLSSTARRITARATMTTVAASKTGTRRKPAVIVVGAGVAGLSAASELVKARHSVLVLEARDRIGGRTHTYTDESIGAPIDLGASFIHGLAGNPLHALAKEHKLDLYQPEQAGELDGSIYSPEGPTLPRDIAQRLSLNSMRTIFSSSKEVAQHQPDTYPQATESVASYCLDESKSTLFEGLTTDAEKQYARALFASWDGWTGAGFEDVSLRYWQSDVNFGGPDATISRGYRGIYEPLADVVRKDESSGILLNEEVLAINADKDANEISVDTRNSVTGTKTTHIAKYCVCTLPLGVLKQRPPVFTPPLPRRALDAVQRLGFGLLNKVVMTYSNCFWPEKAGFLVFLPSPASESLHPMLRNRALLAQNYLPVIGKNTLVFYCGGEFGSELEKLSNDQIKRGMHDILAHHFGPGIPTEPANVTVTRWESDPYSCGSYAYIRPARSDEKEVPTPNDFLELSRPFMGDKLFFAGEATDPDHYASVHGPLLTGRWQAENVMNAMEAEAMAA